MKTLIISGRKFEPALNQVLDPLKLYSSESPIGLRSVYEHNGQVKDPRDFAKTSYADADINAVKAGVLRRQLRGERQVYVDPTLGLNPFSPLAGGGVQITARVPTAAERAATAQKLWGAAYISGLLTTARSFSQTYGYFEWIIAAPMAPGCWSGGWLFSDRTAEGVPPEDVSEIDWEFVGPQQTAHASRHWGPDKARAKHDHVGVHTVGGKPIDVTKPHTYGASWTPELIIFYIDGEECARTRKPNPGLHTPMYMLADLAVGGRWPEQLIGGPPDPAYFAGKGQTLSLGAMRAWSLAD